MADVIEPTSYIKQWLADGQSDEWSVLVVRHQRDLIHYYHEIGEWAPMAKLFQRKMIFEDGKVLVLIVDDKSIMHIARGMAITHIFSDNNVSHLIRANLIPCLISTI